MHCTDSSGGFHPLVHARLRRCASSPRSAVQDLRTNAKCATAIEGLDSYAEGTMPRPAIRAPVEGKCRVCGSSDFGTRNRCKECRRIAQRAAWAADPETARANDRERVRAWRIANPQKTQAQRWRQRYQLDEAALAALLLQQENRCAICRIAEPTCVDHCHQTGRVRGVLCRPCNVALGQFRDDAQLLRAALKYLEEAAT